jgi:DUF971 family protein
MNIKKFSICNNEKNLTINFSNGEVACLPFEYLRVYTPQLNNSAKQKALVSHKKLVILVAIENVSKHGYRFIFDDQHSAIYASEYIKVLVNEHKQRWQHYLAELNASGHSREAMINITQL